MQHNQNKFRYDDCFLKAQSKDNKSIFEYITDNTMFINKNQCLDVTPPFLNYIPSGIPNQNIDIENELRGAIRNNTRCASCKFHSTEPDLASNGLSKNLSDTYPNNRETCKPEFQIIPNSRYM